MLISITNIISYYATNQSPLLYTVESLCKTAPYGAVLRIVLILKKYYPLLNTRLNSFCTGGMAATTTHSSVSTPIEKKLYTSEYAQTLVKP